MYRYIDIDIYRYAYIHIYIYTYTYIYIYIHTHRCLHIYSIHMYEEYESFVRATSSAQVNPLRPPLLAPLVMYHRCLHRTDWVLTQGGRGN